MNPDRAAALAVRTRGPPGCPVGRRARPRRPLPRLGEDCRIGTSCTDANVDTSTKAFAGQRTPTRDARRAPWAAQAYDAVRFATQGLASVGDDGRTALHSELLRRPWQGITRLIGFGATTQFFQADEDGGGLLFRVTGGAARFVVRSDGTGKKT